MTEFKKLCPKMDVALAKESILKITRRESEQMNFTLISMRQLAFWGMLPVRWAKNMAGTY